MTSTWETPEEAHGNRRPQRRNYQLTDEGRQALAQTSQRYRQHLQVFGGAGVDARPVAEPPR